MCNNIYLRPDVPPILNGGYELDGNDMSDWSMYLRIENSVMRVVYMNFEEGLIKYEPITPDFSTPSESYLHYYFTGVLEIEINKKNYYEQTSDGEKSTPYKFISWR